MHILKGGPNPRDLCVCAIQEDIAQKANLRYFSIRTTLVVGGILSCSSTLVKAASESAPGCIVIEM